MIASCTAKLSEEDVRPTAFARTIAHPTMFSIYEPIEHYVNSHLSALDDPASPRVCPSELDLFLLHKLLAYYPVRPRVLDMAADATSGVSSLFFAAEPQVRDVRIFRSTVGVDPNWLPLFQEALADLDIPEAPVWSVVDVDHVGDCLVASEKNKLHFPTLALLAADELAEPERLTGVLDELFAFQNDVVVAIIPLGRIGESAVLETLIADCAAKKSRRLTALREVCPFTAASRIGLVYHVANSFMNDILGQLARSFQGNFQFLTLVRDLIGANMELERLRAEATESESLKAKTAILGNIQRSRIWRLTQRMQKTMRRLAPPGSRRHRCAGHLVRAVRWTKRILFPFR